MRVIRPVAPRSRLASRIERTLNTVLNGDPRVVLEVKAPEMLADADSVAQVIASAVERSGGGLAAQLLVLQTFRRSGLDASLIDSLGNPEPAVRIAGARLCAALRLPDAVPWLGDLLDDPIPAVRDAAVRSLGQVGGRRVVDIVLGHADRLPQYRLAIVLSSAASDIDLESLLRETGSAKITVTVLLACGLRGDALRTPLIVKIAQDRQCETQVRVAACRTIAMIGDPAGADAMRMLASDPDGLVKAAAMRARMRISATRRKTIA